MEKIEATITCHDMFGIVMEAKSEEDKAIIKILSQIVMNNFINSDDYFYSQKAGAFVQSLHEDFIMIEFWKEDGGDTFIKYVNEVMPRRLAQYYKFNKWLDEKESSK